MKHIKPLNIKKLPDLKNSGMNGTLVPIVREIQDLNSIPDPDYGYFWITTIEIYWNPGKGRKTYRLGNPYQGLDYRFIEPKSAIPVLMRWISELHDTLDEP